MYLIFTKDSFIGFTHKQKLFNKLKKERPGIKYTITEVTEKLNPKLLSTPDFSQKELKQFTGYDKVFFEYEMTKAREIAMSQLITLVMTIKELVQMIQYIKLESSELIQILSYIEFLKNIKDDLLATETCVFLEDYFTMSDILDIYVRGK